PAAPGLVNDQGADLGERIGVHAVRPENVTVADHRAVFVEGHEHRGHRLGENVLQPAPRLLRRVGGAELRGEVGDGRAGFGTGAAEGHGRKSYSFRSAPITAWTRSSGSSSVSPSSPWKAPASSSRVLR